MRVAMTLMTLAALSVSSASQALSAERLTDSAYLAAMRCRGLAEARQMDATALDALLKKQKSSRELYVGERGKQMRQAGIKDGRSTDLTRKARIDAELGGVCQAFLNPTSA